MTLSFALLCLAASFTPSTARPTSSLLAQFNGDLLISDLYISDAFQADPLSTLNATLAFTISDQDYPLLRPVRCQVTWRAGVAPPSSAHQPCENSTSRVWFPPGTFGGVQNFQLQFAHTVVEPTVGPCPYYCFLTKFAALNLTAAGVSGWGCAADGGTCEQTLNTTLRAPIFAAVA